MSGSYNVSSEAALDAAIVAIDAASLSDPAGTAYSISFATNITLTSNLAAITLANGDSLSVTGTLAKPAKIVGGGHRGFVVESGNVSLVNFNLAGFSAKGGAGGAGRCDENCQDRSAGAWNQCASLGANGHRGNSGFRLKHCERAVNSSGVRSAHHRRSVAERMSCSQF